MSDKQARGGEGGKDLLILVDTGNTNTVFGVFRNDDLLESMRLATDSRRTVDEYLALLVPLFSQAGLAPAQACAVLISSVVPPMNGTLIQLCRRLFGIEPDFIDAETDTGLPVRHINPQEVGADRIVNAVAARARFGAPVVVVDFGTATTFDVVDASGAYVGGIIAPGASISAEALFSKASRLYRVDIKRPPQLVGHTTVEAVQSGIYYGYIGLVDGILTRLKRELPDLHSVLATGGLAELIARDSEHIDVIDQQLTLDGLKLIYDYRQSQQTTRR